MLRATVFIVIMLSSTLLFSQEQLPNEPSTLVVPEMRIPTLEEMNTPKIAEYEAVLKGFKNWTGNFNQLEFYKEFEMKEGETKQTRFDKLPKLDQNLFFVWSGQNCGNQMTTVFMKWSHDVVQLERIEKVSPPNETNKECATAAKVKEFVKQLSELRKKHAVGFEGTTVTIFKTHAGDIPQKDRELYLKQIREFHDHYKLIDRSEKPKEG